ncbi:sugar transporter SWEET1-like [Euwallacea similis]|uniref:sugar transporter SWEET1-like n=1 Tax=Euwallacea similis TaxID=1736056 RepID=UPI00344BBF90
MEAISYILQPYKEIVGEVASYVTIAQFFSGSFVCRDIYRKGTSKDISSMPFIGGVTIAILMLKYGLLLNDPAMIKVNVVAIVLNIIYSIFFYKFAEDKYEEIYKPISMGIGVLAILLGYTELENPKNLEFRFGLILTILMLALLGAPLGGVKQIIADKDASSIPLPITLMGAIVTFLWLLYGIILQNGFMIVQNVIGCVLCVVQLALIIKYPKPEPSQGQNKKIKSVKKEQ